MGGHGCNSFSPDLEEWKGKSYDHQLPITRSQQLKDKVTPAVPRYTVYNDHLCFVLWRVGIDRFDCIARSQTHWLFLQYICYLELLFIYLGFYVTFNTVQVISRRVVGRAEETSTYSSLGFCTVNCRPTASNYQLSHLRPCWGSNPGLRGGRRECYHSATVAPFRVTVLGAFYKVSELWFLIVKMT